MHFTEVGKDGSKIEKKSSYQIQCGKMKHNCRNFKELFVNNVTRFKLVVLLLGIDHCTDDGKHFAKPFFCKFTLCFYITNCFSSP